MTVMPGSGYDPTQARAAVGRLAQLQAMQEQAARRVLSPEDQQAIDEDMSCVYCGGHHSRACPRVKVMQFHPNGRLAQVEYWRFDEWDTSAVIFEDEGDIAVREISLQRLLDLAVVGAQSRRDRAGILREDDIELLQEFGLTEEDWT